MDNWVNEVLNDAGFPIDEKVRFSELRDLYRKEYNREINVEEAEILAALDHDHGVQKTLVQSLDKSLEEFNKDSRFNLIPNIKDMVLHMFVAMEVIAKRNPTTSILLRRLLKDVQDNRGGD